MPKAKATINVKVTDLPIVRQMVDVFDALDTDAVEKLPEMAKNLSSGGNNEQALAQFLSRTYWLIKNHAPIDAGQAEEPAPTDKLDETREWAERLAMNPDIEDAQANARALLYVGDCIRQNSEATRDSAEALARVLKT